MLQNFYLDRQLLTLLIEKNPLVMEQRNLVGSRIRQARFAEKPRMTLADLSARLEVLGISENRGSGIPAIRHAFAQAGLMDPVFISARGEFKVLFRNAAREASMSDVLEFCRVPRSREELERFTGLNRTSVYYSVIKPLTDKGLLKLTLPEKPRSKWQRFVTA